MSNVTRFAHISSRVLFSLDRDFPGWRDSIPAEENVEELNEESLITLLRNKKRSEFYRTLANNWIDFLKDLYEGTKSLEKLKQEFSEFTPDQFQQWLGMENKFSYIILEFWAKSEPVDVNKLEEGLDTISTVMEQNVDKGVNAFNDQIDTHFYMFLGRTVDGAPRQVKDDVRVLIRRSVDKTKEENKKLGEKQKEFINNSLKKVIQSKFEKIKTGELSPDDLSRKDLLTNEEIRELQTAQERVIVDAFNERKQSNINTMNEASQKFLSVSGKDAIIQKMEQVPEDIISPEIKQIVVEAFDRGGMFPDERNPQSGRSKRAIFAWPDAAAFALDLVASKLEQVAQMKTEELKQGIVYKSCTKWWTRILWQTYLFCQVNNALVDAELAQYFYHGLAKVLSVISFVISFASVKGWLKKIFAVASFVTASTCTELRLFIEKMKQLEKEPTRVHLRLPLLTQQQLY